MITARELCVDSPFEEAETPLEASVARIMAEVLEIDKFGRADSFYDFGGTSLQAISVCARIEAETGRRVLPACLLEHDVLADFAARVEASDAG